MFENRLLKARKKIGLTQKQVAEKALISYSSYSQYENNKAIPPLDIAIRIASVLNTTVEELCGLYDSRTINNMGDVASTMMKINDAVNHGDSHGPSSIVINPSNKTASLTIESEALSNFFMHKVAIESVVYSNEEDLSGTDIYAVYIKAQLDKLSKIEFETRSGTNAEA